MHLQKAIQNVFVQLSASLELLNDSQYVYNSKILSNASIGQHVRHIIEMFVCLEDGYAQGVVNYENRKRDLAIETRREIAIDQLKEIYENLDRANKAMILKGAYNDNTDELIDFAGMVNKNSRMMEPPINAGKNEAKMVMIGNNELRNACFHITLLSGNPLARAVRT